MTSTMLSVNIEGLWPTSSGRLQAFDRGRRLRPHPYDPPTGGFGRQATGVRGPYRSRASPRRLRVAPRSGVREPHPERSNDLEPTLLGVSQRLTTFVANQREIGEDCPGTLRQRGPRL